MKNETKTTENVGLAEKFNFDWADRFDLVKTILNFKSLQFNEKISPAFCKLNWIKKDLSICLNLLGDAKNLIDEVKRIINSTEGEFMRVKNWINLNVCEAYDSLLWARDKTISAKDNFSKARNNLLLAKTFIDEAEEGLCTTETNLYEEKDDLEGAKEHLCEMWKYVSQRIEMFEKEIKNHEQLASLLRKELGKKVK